MVNAGRKTWTGIARACPIASEPIAVEAICDFASTVCFVAHRVMQRLEPQLDEVGIRLTWRPIDLRRWTGWPLGHPLSAESEQRLVASVSVLALSDDEQREAQLRCTVALEVAGGLERRL